VSGEVTPRALFALIPLLALAMRAMYWRRYSVEHLLFFIHNHRAGSRG
jgi:hypothetical protein